MVIVEFFYILFPMGLCLGNSATDLNHYAKHCINICEEVEAHLLM